MDRWARDWHVPKYAALIPTLSLPDPGDRHVLAAAIAAVMNAIADAIPNGAADHMDMPATPAKVWAACQKGLASS